MNAPLKRPHVVMLVDNKIHGDSRVQKQARSMRDLGWRVTLVGSRERESDPDRERINGVPARLVHVAGEANFTVTRSPLWRGSIGPRLKGTAKQAVALAELGRRDALTRIQWQKTQGTDRGLRRVTSRASMLAQDLRLKIAERRAASTDDLRRTRDLKRGAVDKLVVSWREVTEGDSAWQHLDPLLLDWELCVGPVIDQLKPDLIHANDHRMLFVGALAARRAEAAGRTVPLVWDAHEWLPGLKKDRTPTGWFEAQVLVESAHAGRADAVVTVSDTLAEMLAERHHLAQLPTVVTNAPLTVGNRDPKRGLREVIGVDDSVTLMLYSGAISPERGVDLAVRALPELPEHVHLAIVCRMPITWPVEDLLTLAEELGVRHRVHTAPYVPVNQIVSYLSGADVGIATFVHAPNHEISCPTKFYEYAQAQLPMIVTDLKVLGATVEQYGVGEVCTDAPGSFLSAARKVLADPERYRAAYADEDLMHSWSWESQAGHLDAVYRRVLGRGPEPRER